MSGHIPRVGEQAERFESGGESAEYRRLYDEYYSRVLAFCVRRVGREEARDLAMNVFGVAWRRIDIVPAGDDALPWLYGVAYRTVSHHWRSRTRRQRLHTKLASVPAEPDIGPEALVVKARDFELILAAAARLRPKDREVLRLALWEELGHTQIADLLGLRVDTVRQRLHRAKQALAKEFERVGGTIPAATVAREGGER